MTATASVILSAALIALVVAFGAGRALSGLRWLADIPNGRSSHAAPTPRSGGVAIFIGWACAALLLGALFGLQGHPTDYLLFAAPASAAFLLGLADDLWALPARAKLLGQIGVAVLFVALLGSATTLPAPFIGEVSLGLLAGPVTVFWIVAFMNAYNFMDGVNGIASACAIFVVCALAVAGAGSGALEWAAPALLLALAIFGFLPLNAPKARLFMGDGGSQFVGFALAALAVLIAQETENAVSPLFAPIAMLPFLFDVAFTLFQRGVRRRNLFEAHREHLYQLLHRMGRSHMSVTAIYLTATAISTGVAILATGIDPRSQFLAPLGLLVLLGAPAAVVFRKALKKGLLEPGAPLADPAHAPHPAIAE
jgi:UDP-N-acetylmuramyl pentapeptide phosphotransferase/UDP-N-acetylglucosamine-1-phosphate transferase